jgi:glycosyltransferase involved in cell wall biosynthesis
MKPIIIIPAYEPEASLTGLVDTLAANPDQLIVVVDDGSSPTCGPLFEAVARHANVVLLRHAVNQGKGQALKTAMNHVLLHHPDVPGVVTADADGQHLPHDIQAVAAALAAAPHQLWLGCRAFSGDVPLRSRIGNRVTKLVFKAVFSQGVSDTQTGLRGIPTGLLPALLRCSAARYEFEMEMFVLAKQHGVALREVPIETVYIDGNRMSHFNPLLDSLRIYFVLVRFSALALTSAALDFVLFSTMFALTQNVLISITVARLFSGMYNFFGGKRWVFRSQAATGREAVKYVALALVLMGLSYCTITTLVGLLKFNVLAAKVLGEGLLFLLSFSVQNQFVFRDRAPRVAPLAAPAGEPLETPPDAVAAPASRQAG